MKKIVQLFSIIGVCLVLGACNGEGSDLYTVVTTTIDRELPIGYSVEAHISSATTDNLTRYGFCISEKGEPTLADRVIDGESKHYNDFVANIYDLEDNTTYYVRAFIQNEHTTLYGNQVSFTTSTLSKIETLNVWPACNSEVSVGCKISGSDSYINKIGICYSTTQKEPTIENSMENNYGWYEGYEVEYFTISFFAEQNTTYYIRSYMEVEDVLVYGNVIEYKPKAKPNVAFVSADALTSTSAVVICRLTSNDNEIVEKGIYYSEQEYEYEKEYQLFNNGTKVVNDLQEEFYMTVMENLSPKTTYYIYPYVKFSCDEIVWGTTQTYTSL